MDQHHKIKQGRIHLAVPDGSRHNAGFSDDQQGGDSYGYFFHGKERRRKPHHRELRHKAKELKRLLLDLMKTM